MVLVSQDRVCSVVTKKRRKQPVCYQFYVGARKDALLELA